MIANNSVINIEPVFVLCCSRTGSTLLRAILNSHPDFCCPAELHLVKLAQQLMWVYSNTTVPVQEDAINRQKLLLGKVRHTIEGIMQEYAVHANKPVWCEKSVFTVDGIKLISSLFPKARYICLYRNCLDQVFSARETLNVYPTGHEYGFFPFLQRSPDSVLDGLVDYWHAKTSSILGFERDNPEKCIRIKYESIAQDTHTTLTGLLGFLGSHWEEGMESAIFRQRLGGPGDSKIYRTNKINASSIGRGTTIDIQEISGSRVTKMNQLLESLDYAPVNS